ncbi:phage integrase [Limnobaculum xujianqingii]|uniref:phage integrase n=1 Tax=Limnobaculum xujianqingii TaxID=2738837 RepID=UPI00112BF4EF|nr:tyrosine-type recombinase/integrase [Limnobaculum xujianqingii]
MSIKPVDGRYEVDVRPQGATGRRFRRKFDKKAEAVAYEKYVLSNYHDKEWVEKPADKRSLTELIDLWWKFSGCNQEHGEAALGKLRKLDRDMDYPRSYMLTKPFFTKFIAIRLQSGIKASTVNRLMTHLSGMFTALIELDEFHNENPIRQLKPLKEEVPEMVFFTLDEIQDLLKLLDDNERKIAIFSLSTGARWGEAYNVKAEHILDCKVTLYKTKNGKQRTIPISTEVNDYIVTKRSGRLFEKASYKLLREAIKMVKPDMPNGQAVHVLRHTFATHFMINGGNIITLQRILGHSKIQQTMVYAHFSPDHLQDAVTLNPLRRVSTY